MSPPKWDERLMEDIAVAAEYDAASEILDRAKRLANALRVVLDERDALRAGLGEAERALDEILTRGARLIPNDDRPFVAIPHEEAVDRARAALARLRALGGREASGG